MPHIIETALLLLLAFLIGCVVGYLLRAYVFGQRAREDNAEAPQQPVSKPAPAASAPTVVEAAAPTAAIPAEAAAKPAAAKAAPAKRASKSPAPAKAASAKPKATPAKSAVAAEGKPVTLEAPREGKKDDLKRIKGIGPKIESTLNELGIYHFDQIAGWNRKTVTWVDDYLSFKGRIDREEWVKQAKVLAKG